MFPSAGLTFSDTVKKLQWLGLGTDGVESRDSVTPHKNKEDFMILTTILAVIAIGQTKLPGSEMGLEEAKAKARVIVVAKPVCSFIAGLGACSFGSVDLRDSSVLKGKPKQVELERVSLSASGPEVFPKQGEEYLFFINDYANHLQIIKILPKTEENVAAVRRKSGDNP
jgi:hypothetical protein